MHEGEEETDDTLVHQYVAKHLTKCMYASVEVEKVVKFSFSFNIFSKAAATTRASIISELRLYKKQLGLFPESRDRLMAGVTTGKTSTEIFSGTD